MNLNKLPKIILLIYLLVPSLPPEAMAQNAPNNGEISFTFGGPMTIIYDPKGSQLDSISASLLAEDILKVTGTKPLLSTSAEDLGSNNIIIGKIGSDLIGKFIPKKTPSIQQLLGSWERYLLHPTKNQAKQNILVIAGSDDRGTAFGVFDISKRLGVSPWYWWADVPVEKTGEVTLLDLHYLSPSPSVKYRGIFINDEDWGLQPWAAKTFEPETGDIGPQTYAKIFELLLRLKANFIWPAMHPSTKAFFHYPGNVEMAKAYGITLGSSHAEPMLRNNVDEWDHDKYGDFNYVTNKEQVSAYWDSRIKESKGVEAVYTIGMRGVHDSGMKGVKSKEEAVGLLDGIIQDQRKMLEKGLDKDRNEIPQAFTAYKEVLDIYDAGLEVPEDVTIIWPDDNYGYIRRLNGPKENGRPGGSGVYYHESYWGRPHDYLWLSTTHPALIREEMMKAYATGNDKIWVLNVGDIKPHEYNIQLFLDMAYQAVPFKVPGHVREHHRSWYADIFGTQALSISEAMWTYYGLAFERRPEFMAWSQTEPTTEIKDPAYDPFVHGDEIQQRLAAYHSLETQLNAVGQGLKSGLYPAFYQLSYYPVKGASLINQKHLFRKKALAYNQEGRASASYYKEKSLAAHEAIQQETEYYNKHLLQGKWQHIMDMAPRRLPVFHQPEIALSTPPDTHENVGISLERQFTEGPAQELAFNSWTKSPHFFDIYLKNHSEISWELKPSQDWIKVSQLQGSLSAENEEYESRVWVAIDWEKLPTNEELHSGSITLQAGIRTFEIRIMADVRTELENQAHHVEGNGLVIVYAENYSQKINQKGQNWSLVDHLGHSGASLQAFPLQSASQTEDISKNAHIQYDFHLSKDLDEAEITFSALPTHPVSSQNRLRIGVSINEGPVEVLDFKTQGRSEEWKLNVLSNMAHKKLQGQSLQKGKNTIKVFWMDPGVVLDYILIKLDKANTGYGLIKETIYQHKR
ncbi:glycosyl hydrolase 115 family protein [Echinicola sediminis]